MTDQNHDNVARYLYEIGQLKRVKRSGWWIAGIRDPESVAEHAFRTAIIGYVLAQMEGADAEKTALMCLVHDNHEARLNDLHRIARRYVPWQGVAAAAFTEQAARLPDGAAAALVALLRSFEAGDSREAMLARDADQLECLMQAREYQAQGYKDVDDWIQGCHAALKSESAKAIGDACLRLEPRAWWEGLKAKKGPDLFADYDPQAAIAGINAAAGSWKDVDTEAFMAYITKRRRTSSRKRLRL